MAFEEIIPPNPPSANTVGDNEVRLSRRRHLHRKDEFMLQLSLGTNVARRLGMADWGKAKVLFGSEADIGRLRLQPVLTAPGWKIRVSKRGSCSMTLTRWAPWLNVEALAVPLVLSLEVMPAIGSVPAWAAITVPAKAVGKPAKRAA